MEKEKLQKYLGMAVYLMYYNYGRLNHENTFPANYCKSLIEMSSEEYLKEMKASVAFARKQDDYCIPIIISPLLEDYQDHEVKLFFDKLDAKLEECLRS